MAIQFKNMILSFFYKRVRVGDGDTDGENKHHEEVRNECNDAQSGMRMQQEMELQLHDQYAANNNAYVTSTLTFLGGLMAVLGAFSYVYLFSCQEFAATLGDLVKNGNEYTIDALLLTADAAVIVLSIMFLFCLDRGAYQRKEQFIIYAIRCKYFSELKDGSASGHKIMRIFPESYTPFDKLGLDFVQGVFGFMLKAIAIVAFIIVAMTTIKISNLVTHNIMMIVFFAVRIVVVSLFLIWCGHILSLLMDKFKYMVLFLMLYYISIAVWIIIALTTYIKYNLVTLSMMMIFLSVLCVIQATAWCVYRLHKAYKDYLKRSKDYAQII